MPVFNAADVVAETLRSAVAQGNDVEIVAMDDGSTDDSARVIEEFMPRVTRLRQPNRGASAARNALLEQATTDWLVFLDADDVLLPRAVERALAIAELGNADVICADWRPLREIDGAWREGDRVSVPNPDGAGAALAIFRGWWLPPGAVLLRRELAERVGGFRVDLPVIQDARFLFDLARAGARFATTGELGLLYRERVGVSLSRRDSSAFWRDCLLNTELVEDGYATSGELTPAVRRELLAGFELAARELGPTDAVVARRALAGARRQTATGLHASRWLTLALTTHWLLGPRLACRASSVFARRDAR